MTDSKETSASHAINAAPQDVTVTTHEPQTKKKNNWGNGIFSFTVIFSEIIGIICVCLVAVWAANYMSYEGFAWNRFEPDRQFNYHPLFMIVGLVFLYGNAIIVYRLFPDVRKPVLKLLHATLHGGAFIFSVIALVAVFQFHYNKGYPDLYSLHSWIGLVTVILFALQYALGFLVFLLPMSPVEWRAKLMPYHIYFGLLLFIAAIGACLTGINEKLQLLGRYWELNKTHVLGNCLGIFLIVFASLIVYLATSSRYKRMPLPEEMNLRTGPPTQRRERTEL